LGASRSVGGTDWLPVEMMALQSNELPNYVFSVGSTSEMPEKFRTVHQEVLLNRRK
jgi:hypothetical protein